MIRKFIVIKFYRFQIGQFRTVSGCIKNQDQREIPTLTMIKIELML